MDSVETNEDKKNIHHIPLSIIQSKKLDFGLFTFIKNNDNIEVLSNDSNKIVEVYSQEETIDLIAWLITNCDKIDDIEFFKETNEIEGINETS